MAYGIYWTYHQIEFYREAKVSEGEVMRVEKYRGRYASGDYPVYVFHDKSGREWQGSVEYRGGPYYIGQRLSVLYDPTNPAVSVVEGGWTMWLGPFVVIVCGIAVAVSGWRNRN